MINKYPYTDFNEYNMDWIIKTVKDLSVQWAETHQEWQDVQTEWTNYKNYIDNYFENLDLTQEVSDKLNQMAADGTIYDIFHVTVENIAGSVTSEWIADNLLQETGYVIDSSLTVANAAADAKAAGDAIFDINDDLAMTTENTINLSTVKIGNYTVDVDNNYVVVPADSKFFGMSDYIAADAEETYTIVVKNISSSDPISLNVFYRKSNDDVVQQGYANINPRTVTTPADTVAIYFYCSSSSAITLSDPTIQINKGSLMPYIDPLSAKDENLRYDVIHGDNKTYTTIAPMIDTAEGYFDNAYNSNLDQLVHEAGYGLFYKYVKNTDDENAIQCSEFVEALYKGISWENSRYENDINSLKQWAFVSDGSEQHEQDGAPYPRSYYEIVNAGSEYFDTDDKPSYDYMLASELYRYAVNHGFGYEVNSTRNQIRPGDFVFYADPTEPNNYYKHITHVALVVYVGYDNNRVIVLESNTYQYGDNTNVGVGVGYVDAQYYGYGARFPVGIGESHYNFIVDQAFNISEVSTSAWKSYLLFPEYEYDKGFYSVEIEGEFEADKEIFAGANIGGSTQYKKVLVNGDKITYFFYAPTTFKYFYIGFNPGNSYTIRKATLYKGYKPI